MFGFNNNRETIRSLEQERDYEQRRKMQMSERVAKLERAHEHLQSDLLRVEAERDALSQAATDRDALRSTLFDIMSQETEWANATVRRMARMAREALGQ